MPFFDFVCDLHLSVHFWFEVFVESVVDWGGGNLPIVSVEKVVEQRHFEHNDFLVQVFWVVKTDRQTVHLLLVLKRICDHRVVKKHQAAAALRCEVSKNVDARNLWWWRAYFLRLLCLRVIELIRSRVFLLFTFASGVARLWLVANCLFNACGTAGIVRDRPLAVGAQFIVVNPDIRQSHDHYHQKYC